MYAAADALAAHEAIVLAAYQRHAPSLGTLGTKLGFALSARQPEVSVMVVHMPFNNACSTDCSSAHLLFGCYQ